MERLSDDGHEDLLAAVSRGARRIPGGLNARASTRGRACRAGFRGRITTRSSLALSRHLDQDLVLASGPFSRRCRCRGAPTRQLVDEDIEGELLAASRQPPDSRGGRGRRTSQRTTRPTARRSWPLASLATAFASDVLAVPGGRAATALWHLCPELLEALGSRINSTTLAQTRLGLVSPATPPVDHCRCRLDLLRLRAR